MLLNIILTLLARGLIFRLELSLLTFCVYASSDGSGETVRICKYGIVIYKIDFKKFERLFFGA